MTGNLAQQYGQGYLANPGSACPYYVTSTSWGAWCIGAADRAAGLPSRGHQLRPSRGSTYRFGKDRATVRVNMDGTVTDTAALADLFAGADNRQRADTAARGSLI